MIIIFNYIKIQIKQNERFMSYLNDTLNYIFTILFLWYSIFLYPLQFWEKVQQHKYSGVFYKYFYQYQSQKVRINPTHTPSQFLHEIHPFLLDLNFDKIP